MDKENQNNHICTSCTPAIQCKNEVTLNNHNKNYHCGDFTLKIKGAKGETMSIDIKYKDTLFHCSMCNKSWPTASGARHHVKSKSGTGCGVLSDISNISSEDENSDEDVWQGNSAVVDLQIKLDAKKQDETIRKRTIEEAIVEACELETGTLLEKDQAVYITKRLNLGPLIAKRPKKEDLVVLANQKVSEELTKKQADIIFEPIMEKRTGSSNQAVDYPHQLNNTIFRSPYSNVLKQRQYCEINNQHIDVLNTDWDLNPSAKYACAQLLAGSILVDTKKYRAIILNTVEVYGRTRTVDVHREMFGSIKKLPKDTSLPTSNNHYNNIKPITINDADGKKLVVGTQSMNALVTSCLRLDIIKEPSIGAQTHLFDIHDDQANDIRIYLDEQSIKLAADILENKKKHINNFNISGQLRQLRTKFDSPSTYFCCRCSGPITNNHTLQPYTIYTLCNYDSGDDSDAKLKSLLFKQTSIEVLSNEEPKIKKSSLLKLINICKVDETKKQLQKVINMCEDQDNVDVFGNNTLNDVLKTFATQLSSTISKYNDTIAIAIKHRFTMPS